LPFFQAKIRFSGITLFSCILSQIQVYTFELYSKRRFFWYPTWLILRTKIFTPYEGLNQLIGKLWIDFSARRHIFLHKLFFKILLFWAKKYSSGPSFSYLNNWRWLVGKEVMKAGGRDFRLNAGLLVTTKNPATDKRATNCQALSIYYIVREWEWMSHVGRQNPLGHTMRKLTQKQLLCHC
jgi:hypothetical protein